MSPENALKLFSMLKRHEGFRPSLYRCPAGFQTIGFGHNCDAHLDAETYKDRLITTEEAENLLANDIRSATLDCINSIRSFERLSDEHQAVLINMAYNLGIGKLLEFKKMLRAFIFGDNKNAAREMFHSRWATQVGSRCSELMFITLTEDWL